ncbi:MAG TPA: nucleoside hydrolase [Phycisphaerae bacterium]|nr:nucleoside hydrolase [Phycisphaerae bacterium]
MPHKIILDTDIGDDIDDAYALAFALASSELDLLGVTTVFGNTVARARQGQTILKLAGREDVPVAAGVASPISPRVEYKHAVADAGIADHPVPWPTKCAIDDVRPCQDPSALPPEQLPPIHPQCAVRFLIDTITANPGLTVVTVGAQTNLAVALSVQPSIVTKIGRVVSMAAVFSRQIAEWNICCDPVAAALVAASGLDVTYVGLDVTTKCVLSEQQLQQLLDSDRPVARNLAHATRFWQGDSKARRPMLHDPLAVATLVQPELVTTKTGTVSVELTGQHAYGQTLFAPDEKGRHHICVDVKAEEFLKLWLDRVLSL